MAQAPAPSPGKGEGPVSQKELRALLRASPLVPPEVRTHWLRVLPHLTAQQRAELATLLGADGDTAVPRATAPRPHRAPPA